MNADKALESRMLPIEQGCYMFVYSLYKNIGTRPVFPLRRLRRKSEPCEEETFFSCLGITYLTIGISNPIGAKLFCWRLGINSFSANWNVRRSFTQRGHCITGAKLSRWYLGIISSWRQLSSTYKIYTT